MAQVTPAVTFENAFSRDALADVWSQLKLAKTDSLTGKIRIPVGWDRTTVRRFDRQLAQHLGAIERKARSGTYTFRPFVYHYQPKPDGGERKISYSGIRDRIVQGALHNVLAPVVDARLTPSAFAYREGVSTHDAIRRIYATVTSGQPYFVKSDFVKFFDRLDHGRLHRLISTLEVDRRAQQLAWRFVRTGDIPREKTRADSYPAIRTQGVPQGGVVSGLLSNLYLIEFDEAVRGVSNATLIRYADDFIVFCPDEDTCRTVFTTAKVATQNCLLELHDHSKTVECGHINDGVNFVGFRVRGTKVSIKPANVAKFKRRLQNVITKHEDRLQDGDYSSPRECIRQVFHHVNLKVTGVQVEKARRSWIACFRIVNDVGQIRQLDRWVWQQLSRFIRRLRLPHKTRAEVYALGYRGLLREYWYTRRHMRSFTLPFQGMVKPQPIGARPVQEGANSYLSTAARVAPADK